MSVSLFRLYILMLGGVLLSATTVYAQTKKQPLPGTTKLNWGGELEVEWAYGLDDYASHKFETIFKPELNIDLENGTKITAIARFRHDTINDLQPPDGDQDSMSGISRRGYPGDHTEAELRELYFKTAMGRSFLTVGKQQIVWGKADGLKVLDVVNPQDFREFILDDFDDSRIPLWTVNVELPVGESNLQLLWIPDQTYNVSALRGSRFEFTSPLLVPSVPSGVQINQQAVDKPDQIFADSDFGMRLSGFKRGWDLSLVYFYHYQDSPVLFRGLSSSSQPTVIISPRYIRSHLIGGTFSNAFGKFVLRGEMGLSTDRYFLSNNPADNDGVIKTEEIAYVLGLDWSGITDTLISAQLFQSYLLDNPDGLVRDQTDTTVTFLARRKFKNETIKLEILLLHNLNNNDGLVRPKVSYELKDNVKVWMGVDIFYGNKKGLFGQFAKNDRVVLGVQFSF